MRIREITIILALTAQPALSDIRYEETITMTGGAMMAMAGRMAGHDGADPAQPSHATVAVSGHKMVHKTDRGATVIDLDAQTITNIDFNKKTYYTATFDEMKGMMDSAAQRMGATTTFDASSSDTGKTRTILNLPAHEVITTVKMNMSMPQLPQPMTTTVETDGWYTSEVKGIDDLLAFYKTLSDRAGWAPGAVGRPEMGRAMAQLWKDSAKLKGLPLLQTTTVKGGMPGMGMGMGGRLGALGRRGQLPNQDAAGAQNLIETKTEVTGISNDPVDASLFALPAGFQKTENPMQRMQPRRQNP